MSPEKTTMSPEKKMIAAQVHALGAARFAIEHVPIPEAGPGQLLIRVESSGVNFSDVKRRRGDAYPFATTFPFVPGGEIAGTVISHGPGVDGPPVGARVFALAGTDGYGGYAQYAVTYAQTAVPIPDGISFDQASVCLVAGTTAKLVLTEAAHLRAGETVLIPAATGGVGSFAVAIARQLGAGKIIAAVGSEEKRAAALALGAHEVVDYSRSDWRERVMSMTEGKGVDVAGEASGGSALEQTLRCLGAFGRLVVYGAASGTSATLSPAALERLLYAPAPNQSLIGFNIGGWFMARPAEAGAALASLMRDAVAGIVSLPKITTMPIGRAQEAHELLEKRRTSGKLVLKPWA